MYLSVGRSVLGVVGVHRSNQLLKLRPVSLCTLEGKFVVTSLY